MQQLAEQISIALAQGELWGQLEAVVAERTAEFQATNASLKQEIIDRQQVEIALRQSEAQLLSGNGNDVNRQQARQKAHKLVGTLGVFALTSAMKIARQIETLLNRSTILSPSEALPLKKYVAELGREIEKKFPSQQIDIPSPDLPL
jgi:HPt (histidine-containing phosphotransfer) domain-containing protein